LASSFPLCSFLIQPIDRSPIFVATRLRDKLRWSMRMLFKLRDIIVFSLVIVFPVGEQRIVLVSAIAGGQNEVPRPPPETHLDIATQFQATFCPRFGRLQCIVCFACTRVGGVSGGRWLKLTSDVLSLRSSTCHDRGREMPFGSVPPPDTQPRSCEYRPF
jgi:hypothetical protein